ncbi:MAG: DUF1365 domain-containing protein [Pseudomonadota bacterium]
MKAALYKGRVTHRRLKPVDHRLSYRVFSMLIDLDALDAMDQALTWFSRSRFNLFSFYDRDYGFDKAVRGPVDLAAHVRETLAAAGVGPEAGARIELLCYPRILGYAFNPIAVYYCYDREERLRAIFYQVSSTFGERHTFLIPVEEDDGVVRQTAAKRLHVSPFMGMDMRYDFRLSRPQPATGSALAVIIDQADKEGPILHAAFTGVREQVTDKTLRRAFFSYPLMTLKIIAGIHFEAARLMAKGMRLLTGPKAPSDPVSLPAQRKPARARRAG